MTATALTLTINGAVISVLPIERSIDAALVDAQTTLITFIIDVSLFLFGKRRSSRDMYVISTNINVIMQKYKCLLITWVDIDRFIRLTVE